MLSELMFLQIAILCEIFPTGLTFIRPLSGKCIHTYRQSNFSCKFSPTCLTCKVSLQYEPFDGSTSISLNKKFQR